MRVRVCFVSLCLMASSLFCASECVMFCATPVSFNHECGLVPMADGIWGVGLGERGTEEQTQAYTHRECVAAYATVTEVMPTALHPQAL